MGIIEAGHFSADTAYLAVDRHRLDDYKPYIYRTSDGGRHWTLIADGIPDGSFVNVVREDPVKPGLLYAGTEFGVYVSFDDGDHWQSLQQNLPITSVRDIDVHGDDLVIATHGRAFWIMDDVTPLRQLTQKVAQSGAWLFKPALAYRVMPAGFTGTPLPKDEPRGENPPFGAYLDYYLESAATTPVGFDIYDAKGVLVRHFASNIAAQQPDISKIESTPDWYTVATPPAASPGMHRFVWDLHYALPVALKGPHEFGDDGLWAAPGRYSVKLTVDGRTYSQPLQVAKDPRVTASVHDLEVQFALAQEIETTHLQVAAVKQSIGALMKQLALLKGKVHGETAVTVDALTQTLESLSGVAPPVNPDNSMGVPPADAHNLLYLSGALAVLEQAVESADAAPTPDVRTGFRKQRATLQDILDRWRQVQLAELPRANAALQSAGLAPLKQ